MTMDTPNLGGNIFFLACHVILILPQIYYGIRYKTWAYLFGMFCGHAFEIVGFAARVRMHFGQDGVLTYITLTIGPAFFSAAIYLCLARIITVYGHDYSRFSPHTYTITFMLFDFVALILQATGGSMLGSDNKDTFDTGLVVMKTGLAAHLAAICIFIILALELAFRIARLQNNWNPKFRKLQRSWNFKMFLTCLAIATVAILIRTAYRVAELSAGYQSGLANNEVAFMFLEGTIIIIATTSLAIAHPGICFEARWHEADFQLRKPADIKHTAKSDSNILETPRVERSRKKKQDNGFS